MYANRATLIGFLGKDAEVKTTKNQRFVHRAVASDQAELEEPRNRRTPERNDLASLHRVGEVRRIRGDSHQGRARTDRRRDSHSRVHAEGHRQEGPGREEVDHREFGLLRSSSWTALMHRQFRAEGGAAQEVAEGHLHRGSPQGGGVSAPERDFVHQEEHDHDHRTSQDNSAKTPSPG